MHTEDELKNGILNRIVVADEAPLKEVIVEYVGQKLNPDNDEVNLAMIVDVLASEFPDLILAMAHSLMLSALSLSGSPKFKRITCFPMVSALAISSAILNSF